MGNVVAGEALHLADTNQVVNTYIASQAALPAHAYDASLASRSPFTPETPNVYAAMFTTNHGSASRRINFLNTNDWALSVTHWELNQNLKPDSAITIFGKNYVFDGYPYDGQQSYDPGSVDDSYPWNYFFEEHFGAPTNYFNMSPLLTDRYEVMAYAAQARSQALGRSTGVGNLTANLDLTTIWPGDLSGHNYGDHKWHSAQFRSTNMRQKDYWNTLLFSSQFGFNIQNP